MKRLNLIALLIGILNIQIYAQTAAIASGKTITNSNGSITYSVGQVVYETISGSTGSLFQGVNQPFEITTVTGIKVPDIILQCSAYPNPTTDYLILKVEDTKNISYQLFDMNGKLLIYETTIDNETIINMNSFTSATYILKVLNDNKQIKSFQIIKK